MRHIFKHLGNDCRQKNTTAENKQQHFAGMFSGNSDLMTGALIHRLTGGFESYSLCVQKFASGIFAVTSVVASVQHLTLLSIDRYIAIKYPLQVSGNGHHSPPNCNCSFRLVSGRFSGRFDGFIYSRPSFHVLFSQFFTASQYFHPGLLPNCCLF